MHVCIGLVFVPQLQLQNLRFTVIRPALGFFYVSTATLGMVCRPGPPYMAWDRCLQDRRRQSLDDSGY